MLSSSHTASTRLSRSIISQPVRACFFSPFDVDTKNRGHFLPPALWPRDITGIKHKLSWPRPFSSSDFKHKLSHGSLSLSLRSQRTTWYKRSSCSHYFWGGSRHSRMNIYDRIGPTIQPLLSKVMWNPVWYKWRGIGSKKFIAGICQKSTDVSRKKKTWRKRGEP